MTIYFSNPKNQRKDTQHGLFEPKIINWHFDLHKEVKWLKWPPMTSNLQTKAQLKSATKKSIRRHLTWYTFNLFTSDLHFGLQHWGQIIKTYQQLPPVSNMTIYFSNPKNHRKDTQHGLFEPKIINWHFDLH